MFLSPCLVTNPAVCARLSVFTWSCVRVLLEGGWSEPACLWAQGKSPSPRPCMGNGTDWGKECSPRGAEEKETLIGPAPCPKAIRVRRLWRNAWLPSLCAISQRGLHLGQQPVLVVLPLPRGVFPACCSSIILQRALLFLKLVS